MRFNFLEIKRKKDRYVFLLLLLLMLSYTVGFFITAYAVLLVARIGFVSSASFPSVIRWVNHLLFHTRLGLQILLAAVLLSLVSWLLSGFSLRHIVSMFKGYPPDPEDRYHKQFINIIDEVKIASGIKNIEPRILPDTDINAFTCQDFSGKIVIGVTEGALAKLTRHELESVVGHEMGHIMSGDVVTTTMFSAIMSVYAAMKEVGLGMLKLGLAGAYSYRAGRDRDSRVNIKVNRSSGINVLALIGLVIFIISLLWSYLNYMLITLISRQREYRADALAIKIVRDPISLARALLKIKNGHKSVKLITDKTVGALFISNPFTPERVSSSTPLAESLFNTHPPITDRISIVCNIAGVSPDELERQIIAEEKAKIEGRSKTGLVFLADESQEAISQADGPPDRWMVFIDSAWKGPFSVEELATMGLSPDTFIKREGDERHSMIQDNPEVMLGLFGVSARMEGAGEEGDNAPGDAGKQVYCPRCKDVLLSRADYEGVMVLACPNCLGILLDREHLKKILLRKEVGFSDEIRLWGDKLFSMVEMASKKYEIAPIKREPSFVCPVCGERKFGVKQKTVSMMYKRVFAKKFPVQVDICGLCGLIWFDKGELEVLQYMFEKKAEEMGVSVEEVWNNIPEIGISWGG